MTRVIAMPRSVYVFPAHFISEDKTTNLVSATAIIERLEVARISTSVQSEGERQRLDEVVQIARKGITIKAVAVWMMEHGDDEHVFEHAFAVRVPGLEIQLLGLHPFQFESATRPFRRFKLQLSGFPPVPEPCVVELESRVRRLDESNDSDWIIQSYPLIVDVSDIGADEHHETHSKQTTQ